MCEKLTPDLETEADPEQLSSQAVFQAEHGQFARPRDKLWRTDFHTGPRALYQPSKFIEAFGEIMPVTPEMPRCSVTRKGSNHCAFLTALLPVLQRPENRDYS